MFKKSDTITMGCLAGSAALLAILVTLVFLYSGPTVVQAGSMQTSGGDYSVTVARLSEGQEVVWILDSRNRTIGIYQYDNSKRRLELEETFTLQQVSAATR